MSVSVFIAESDARLTEVFAQRFVEAGVRAIHERGRFHSALTGGSSARFYATLPAQPLDWSRVELYWSDERAVPPEHPGSNAGLAEKLLIAPLGLSPEQVHRMPAERDDLEAAALLYARALPARLDLVHLGLGDDGHIASLFPRQDLDSAGDEHVRVRAIRNAPKPHSWRLTLTLPYLAAARHILITAAGARKARAVRDSLDESNRTLPCALLLRHASSVALLIDAEAAALLER
jgi:6-phosphogluconolactonase